MKSLPWFRMYSEAVDDPKLKLLAYEDRWHFVAILCCKCQGVLDRDDDEMVRRMVAVKLGLDLRELDEVARRLSEVGLIDRETFQPIAWDERQFKSDNSTDRVRKYRERKQKQQRNEAKRYTNVSETAQEADTDTESEAKEAGGNADGVAHAKQSPVPYRKIVDLYHEILPELRSVAKLTSARKAHIRQRWQSELQTLDRWRAYFESVRDSNFLMGHQPPGPNRQRPWQADFDFLITERAVVRHAEGKYVD